MSESERGRERESGEKAHSKFRQAARERERERAGERVTFQTDDEDEGRTTN